MLCGSTSLLFWEELFTNPELNIRLDSSFKNGLLGFNFPIRFNGWIKAWEIEALSNFKGYYPSVCVHMCLRNSETGVLLGLVLQVLHKPWVLGWPLRFWFTPGAPGVLRSVLRIALLKQFRSEIQTPLHWWITAKVWPWRINMILMKWGVTVILPLMSMVNLHNYALI